MSAIWTALKSLLTLPTVLTVVRTLFKFGGGFIVAKGWADDDGVTQAAGAAATLVGVIWGVVAAAKAKQPALPPAP